MYRYGDPMDFEEELMRLMETPLPGEPRKHWGALRCVFGHEWCTLSVPTSDGERVYKAVCSRCSARSYGYGLGS